ncbi:hypothetical protein L3Q82_022742 [Scortum barcoo]|uniref:Uncharacterized protein n=1 Tax=Scortum barcoo TaxID=214431 RepID=A0ACB8WW09_9TELE|nr:hypothetical protein L3Q82_022742 [Scortum barcoo]
MIVDPRIQEEQCGFRPGRGTLDQLYTLCRVLEGLWEFAQPVYMCFVDLEKAFDRVPRGILWGVLLSQILFPVHVGLRQGCPLSPVLFIIFMDRISRRSQGPEGVRFGNHRISSLLFADDVVLLASSSQDLQRHVLERFAAECEAAGMRISTSKSEGHGSRPEKGGVPSPGGWRGPASSGGVQVSQGSCSRVRERWSVRLTGGLVQRPQLCASVYRTVVVKKELSRKAKLSIYLPVNLRFPPSPMVMNFG